MSFWLPEGAPAPSADVDSRILFLDRDGVLISDADYLSDPDGVKLIPGVAGALARARRIGVRLICVTNQSGIGRGYYTEADFFAVQARVDEALREGGVVLDAVYYCPHAPEAACRCRKPATGLLDEAALRFRWDPARSAMVGDKLSDIDLGLAAGLRPFLVRTGEGLGSESRIGDRAGVTVVDDLPAAVALFLEDPTG